ncbi:hypothetical protein [Methanococcus sp. CF]
MRFTVNDSLITSVAVFIIAFLLQGVHAVFLSDINNPIVNQIVWIIVNTLRFLGVLFAVISIVFWKKGVVIRY